MKIILKPNPNSKVVGKTGDSAHYTMVDICDASREDVWGSTYIDLFYDADDEEALAIYDALYKKGEEVVVEMTEVQE